MRRPERINGFLNILKSIWSNDPELRFGQLISLAFFLRSGQVYDGRLWHIEDDDFLERLMENIGVVSDAPLNQREAERQISKLQSSIRGRIYDLAIFEGTDWRLE